MAKLVGYFEDAKPEHYSEGPFVMVAMLDGTVRIEMENKDAKTSTRPKDEYLEWAYEVMGGGPCTLRGEVDVISERVDTLNKRYRMRALDDLTRMTEEMDLYDELKET